MKSVENTWFKMQKKYLCIIIFDYLPVVHHHPNHSVNNIHATYLCTSLVTRYNRSQIFKLCIIKTWYLASVHWFTNFCNISIYPPCVTHPSEHGETCTRYIMFISFHTLMWICWFPLQYPIAQ
jgi:hypothetical protein